MHGISQGLDDRLGWTDPTSLVVNTFFLPPSYFLLASSILPDFVINKI